ncbi:MAG: metal-dependent transcriptional regulator [Deltaproteobacteria bacterium]|nr:metal-dependent transcriptional regulator [Deltaproteobacteria bacterium]
MKISKVKIEDALKCFFDHEYESRPVTSGVLAEALGVSHEHLAGVVEQLQQSELVEKRGENFFLTPAGRKYALEVVRAHRIYETFLARQSGFLSPEWHIDAHNKEHELSAKEVNALAAYLGEPRFDPHGDPIPTAAGEIKRHSGLALDACPIGYKGRVLHIEDEPWETYQELVERGFSVGSSFFIQDKQGDLISIYVEGARVKISFAQARQINVRPLAGDEEIDLDVERLSMLKQREEAVIFGISPTCIGAERSRLLDLGFVASTVVSAEFASLGGSPIAYRLHNTLIGLRKEQGDKILIKRKAGGQK